jgi:hypothetical protein
MLAVVEDRALVTPQPAAIRKQLGLLLSHEQLRNSRRSVAFLRYIVEETLLGRAEELKERTIGVHVFGKALTYDTNLDHVVRTAASELRKRINLYYSEDVHRSELRILLLPGSYVPQFMAAPLPAEDISTSSDMVSVPLHDRPATWTAVNKDTSHAAEGSLGMSQPRWWLRVLIFCSLVAILTVSVRLGISLLLPAKSQSQRFWAPLVSAGGPVLIAVGDVPHGPPINNGDSVTTPAPTIAGNGPPTVPFTDAVAIARIAGVFSASGKDFTIRRGDVSSFADLREGPVVLVGAFNNGWSLRLLRDLRFSLAMDPVQRVLYIRDRDHPESRAWLWSIDPHPGEKDRVSSKTLYDYALISRVLDSETGRDVVVIGGLYTYGTAAAGEFVSDPQMGELSPKTQLGPNQKRIQIVLKTQVTEGTAGPPRIVAVSIE